MFQKNVLNFKLMKFSLAMETLKLPDSFVSLFSLQLVIFVFSVLITIFVCLAVSACNIFFFSVLTSDLTFNCYTTG